MSEKMCPAGCGEKYNQHIHVNDCPWLIALNKALGKSPIDWIRIADLDWRIYWKPQIYDWVVLECGPMISIHQIRSFNLSKEDIEYCGIDFIAKKDFMRPATADERQRGIFAQLENQEYSIGRPSVKFSSRGNTEEIVSPEVSAHPELSSKEFFEQAMRPKGWPKPFVTGLTGTIDITPVEPCPCCNGKFWNCPECGDTGEQRGKTAKARI